MMHAPPSPLDIARKLLVQPTAPFHEGRVMGVITALLGEWGIPHRFDRHGNLIARYAKGRGPRWALVAHTDHPGIEITSRAGNTVKGTFLGGTRPEGLPGARVRLHDAGARAATGTVVHATRWRGEKRVTIRLDDDAPGIGPGAFGGYDLPAPSVTTERIVAAAMDDLGGCATTLAVLAHLKARNLPGHVWGVFTRAEEVGFAGAQLLAEDGTLPEETLVVSIECSMELPGARQGQGPVIRVGDRASTFDGTLEHHLHQSAQRLQKADPAFTFQRQLMTGGTCEGTVFAARGYRTIGLAYPLLNYHNMAEPAGIAPEEIASADFLGGVRLLLAAIADGRRVTGSRDAYYQRLQQATRRYRERL
ncbi:MAG: M20/M25/M40 family metallo-hydrolase [Nitrospirae bacterium]|nr:M20/M25/M40 family metallo-hydrolase [Nitrospirota bacterium]